ncbi:phosphomevalonate kinase [Phytophthora boehmeriae]|uniref:Phosphomevalonate kinase n=1 Tax=Phytophthora boehmeriae TaxID=109152 RepID=A0A8T1X5W4_9STRA|nr:phosphomevalonate kinase [Phytophthora boehmeriae]
MSTFRPTCVSAPGKVLLVGGYLVLDEQYSGLVLASTARFYSQVVAKPREDKELESVASEWRRLFPLMVESQQFSQSIDGWIEENDDGRFRFQLSKGSDRNSYIEETVLCAINGVAGLEAFRTGNTFQQLANRKTGVHVTLRGDNDFYSQVQRLQEAKQELRQRGEGKLVALKTGMGSSAALVTSLVAALTAFFVPTISLDKQQEHIELVHNLAQLSHCYVQRKIGSGFDVSAACFGSQSYTRFPASMLNMFTSEDALTSRDIASCITNRELWSTSNRVSPFRIPTTFHMMMGDVSSGSATVSMVRQVLTWKKENHEHALRVMTMLHEHNKKVEQGFADLCELEDACCAQFDWEFMATQSRQEWSNSDPTIGAALMKIHEAFLRVRELLREMGASAGVPIEPPEQTKILEATLAIPGVLTAGVPGAGGYDAICVIVLHESVLQAVEDLWVQWPSTHPGSIICPLLCDIERGISAASASGLQVHAVE